MQSVYVETYGCQMNEYDSELVKSILAASYNLIEEENNADAILINTCAVRENAYNKIRGRLGRLKAERQHRKLRVGVLGCMAQGMKDELLKTGAVDFVVGPDEYRKLPELLMNLEGNIKEDIVAVELNEYESYEDIAPTRREGVNAWIAIMRGCDNFCTFCIVPFTRGRERSRSVHSIVEEAHQAVSQGFPQITLLGQNVNSFHHEGANFTELMKAVSDVPGLKRIRFTSPHPMDFPYELLKLIAERPNICNQIHLPHQSGSSSVLKRMNRGYTRQDYVELAHQIRAMIPGVAISTDIITGFPGESEADFQETIEVMQEVKFESAYIFNYSPREGTMAAKKFADDVSEEEKKRRIILLNDYQRALTILALNRHLDQDLDVLIEEEYTKLSDKQCQGRTMTGLTVVLPQDGMIRRGEIKRVRIESCTSHVLLAQGFNA